MVELALMAEIAELWTPPTIAISDNQVTTPVPNLRPAFVSPFAVENHPNPVYYSPLAGPSKIPDVAPSVQTPFLDLDLDLDLQQLDDYIPFSLGLDSPEMETFPGTICSITDNLHQREHKSSSNGMFADIEQGKASWPLSDDLAQDHVYPEEQMQIDHSESSPEHRQMVVDVVTSISPTTRPVGQSRAITPASAPNLAPRKRVAGFDLRPLETDNAKTRPFNNQNGINNDGSKQGRRPNQRTLMPKSSSPRNVKATASPQSSKSTPDSARTDSSFASTATYAASLGSAISTPSIGTKSPANSFNPSESNLTCRDCGKTFQTPGQQK
jgi:hypothetical protein